MAAKVLIVEDDPTLAFDLQHEVETLGYTVVGMAESADEALMASEKERPNLALMDIKIGGTMDGIQTAHLLNSAYEVPVIFLTSATDEVTISRAAREASYGYLIKPYRRHDLSASIQTALQKAAKDSERNSAHEAMAATIESLGEAVFTVSVDHRVQFMNAAAEQLTGCQLEDVRGVQLQSFVHLTDSRRRPLPELTCAMNAATLEFFGCSLVREGGDRVLLDVAVNPITGDGRQLAGFVVTLREASERMRTRAVEETLDEVSCFQQAPTPMVQFDKDGNILRVNDATVREAGVDAARIVGRDLQTLSMDPDPYISETLFHKLLQAETVLATVKTNQFH